MQAMIHGYRVQRRGHEDILRDNTITEPVLEALWTVVVMTFSKTSRAVQVVLLSFHFGSPLARSLAPSSTHL